MPKSQLSANSVIETLNQEELSQALTKQTTTWFQEQARGFTTARFAAISTIVSQNVQVPAHDDEVFGPDQGYVWAVQRVTVSGLISNDSLAIYRSAISPMNLLGSVSAANPSTFFGSRGVILRGGEKLILSGNTLVATGDVVVNGEAVQVSELDIYKVL